jgi:predicted RNA methylase
MTILVVLSGIAVIIISLVVTLWFSSEIISWVYTYFFTKAPYIPNKKKYVRQALELVGVTTDDVVFDLGSGDGRVLAIALGTFQAKKAVGYEADPLQALKTRLRLGLKRSYRTKWEVHTGDLFNADLAGCIVLYLYLYPQLLVRVRDELLPRLKKGTRVVVCRYAFEGLLPNKTFKSEEYEIFLYVI